MVPSGFRLVAAVLLSFAATACLQAVAPGSLIAAEAEAVSIPADFAVLEAELRKPVPLDVENQPDYLTGALIYQLEGKARPANLKFTVTRGGPVYLMASWEYDGNSSGGWTKERRSPVHVRARGWLQLGRCPWDATHILYYRDCSTGDAFDIRTRKYNPPVVLTGLPLRLEDPEVRDSLPVASRKQLDQRRYLQLLKEKKFEELDKAADRLRKEKAKYPNGDRQLDVMYQALWDPGFELNAYISNESFVERIERLREWNEARKGSMAARVCLAKAYNAWGSFARGTAAAARVSQENMRLFGERRRTAYNILQKAKDSELDKDPELYTTMIYSSLALNESQETVEAYADEALSLDPAGRQVVRAMATRLMPRWGGRPGALKQFAERVVEQTEATCGSMQYAVLVEHLSRTVPYNTFDQYQLSWEKTKQGYRDLERLYPKSRDHLDRFCWLACIAGDVETAAELFERIGDDYQVTEWDDGRRYKKWRKIHEPGPTSERQTLRRTAHVDGVLDVAINQKLIATCGRNQQLRVWNAATGEKLVALSTGRLTATCLVFSPDGKMLIAGMNSGQLYIFSMEGGASAALQQHQSPISDLAFSADGRYLAASCTSGRVVIWSTAEPEVAHEFLEQNGGSVSGLDFSPDSSRLATVGKDGRIVIHDVKSGEITAEWKPESGASTAVEFAPDGKHLATADGRGQVCIWEVATQKQTAGISPTDARIHSLAYSPDGSQLAIGCGVGRAPRIHTAFVWSAQADEEPRPLPGHRTDVVTVNFSPDGKTIATGSTDWSLRLWSADGGE